MLTLRRAARESCREAVEKRSRSVGRGGQRHDNAESAERRAAELQRAVMALDDRGHDGQPEAAAAGGPVARWVEAQQALAEPRQDVVGDAGARVLDGELHGLRDVLDADG